jgi:tryptophanase
MKTLIEPFRIKSIEHIKMTTRDEREKFLKEANYNVFKIRSENVILDFLTDSGTSAMSSDQWAAIMKGDESYACAKSWYNFEKAVKKITNFKNIIPTHQGRAAERLLFSVVLKEGDIVPNNNHFDTTRANVEFTGAEALDLVIEEGKKPELDYPFKGNIDIKKLEDLLEKESGKIPLCMITITNNAGGGQPVSMQNIRETKQLLGKYNIPLFLDACRFAENAYFIKKRENGYESKSVLEIVNEMFSYADGCTMSAKKDAFANIGGFIALNDEEVTKKTRNLLILTEGFPTYGGMTGRDLEAIAVGLEEIIQEDYLNYRLRTAEYLGEILLENGISIVRPAGGHALYIDANAFYPHIPYYEFPGQALCCELYLEGGIRGCEIGTFMFGKKNEDGKDIAAGMELVRLAFPRRVYTQAHFDYAAEVIIDVYNKREGVKGLKITYEPEYLRHFTSDLERL